MPGLMLGGCAAQMPKSVEVPVPVPCVKSAPTPPADCFAALAPGFQLDDATACLLKFRDESLAYQTQADALLTMCETTK